VEVVEGFGFDLIVKKYCQSVKVLYVLVLGSVGAMNGMRQIPALGIAIPQLLNIRFVITITNDFLVFSTFISLTDCVHSRAFCT
jgi:hypothetical protein